MNKYFWIISTLIFIGQKAYCVAEKVSPELEQSLKTQTNEPGFMSIVFALLIVIFLIYVTGLIYSNLNLVGARTLKQQLKNYDLTKAIVLSTTQLGQGKNLHVIELNQKRYLIGAGQNSINLLKELDDSPTQVEGIEEKLSEDAIDKNTDTIIINDEEFPQDEFDIHKKYL